MMKNYTDINSQVFDRWVKAGWEWGKAITPDQYQRVLDGEWEVFLTPTKPVPKSWFGTINRSRILGLASGGGQQMPIFTALGADCTVLDYSQEQLNSERMVAKREGYQIKLVKADMTKGLPFEDESFDLIFHPVSNCYVEDVIPIWVECYRVLKKGGILLSGLDNGMNFVFGDDEKTVQNRLPFNPLKDRQLYEESIRNDWGIQFSHTIEEQIGGQLKAGFVLEDIYQDTNASGNLYQHNIPCFWATKSVKK